MQGTRELSDGSALAGTDDRTGRDAEATSHVDDETRLWPRPRLPGRAVENRRELQFQSDSTALCSTLTHRLHAHELPTRAERRVLGLGGSQVRRPTRHSPGQAQQLRGLAHLPRIPLQAVLIQWAAKVAFFKLKLDQLMDSLCRVCLAESKQNL